MTLFANRTLRLVALVAITSAAGVVFSTPALAHSELISSSPDNGAVLKTAPTEVVLTFDEEVLSAGSGIAVTGPDGSRYDIANTLDVVGTKATIALKPASTDGRYDVSYRIVSADGHITSAALTYTLTGQQSGSPASTPAQPTTSTSTSSGSSDSGGSTVWVLGAGAIGIVLIIAVIAVFTRGRRG